MPFAPFARCIQCVGRSVTVIFHSEKNTGLARKPVSRSLPTLITMCWAEEPRLSLEATRGSLTCLTFNNVGPKSKGYL